MGIRQRNKIYFWGVIIGVIIWLIVWCIVKLFGLVF